jgi:hypothetical protein
MIRDDDEKKADARHRVGMMLLMMHNRDVTTTPIREREKDVLIGITAKPVFHRPMLLIHTLLAVIKIGGCCQENEGVVMEPLETLDE